MVQVLVCFLTFIYKIIKNFIKKYLHYILFQTFFLVDKTIISRDYLKKLCNDMVPSSFRSISEINYTKLNSKSLRLIGCYGNHALIAKFLLDKKAINRQMYVIYSY